MLSALRKIGKVGWLLCDRRTRREGVSSVTHRCFFFFLLPTRLRCRETLTDLLMYLAERRNAKIIAAAMATLT